MNPFDWTTVMVGLAVIPAVLFPVLYTALAPWQRSQLGRQVMGLSVVIAVFLSLALYVRTAGPIPAQGAVAAVLYGVLTFLLWRQVWLLWKFQRKHRAE